MNKEEYNFDPMTGERIVKEEYNFDPMMGERIVKEDKSNEEIPAVDAQQEIQVHEDFEREIPIPDTQYQHNQPDEQNTSIPPLTTDQYQEKPTENKDGSNKIIFIIVVVTTAIILIAASFFAGYFLVSGHSVNQKPTNPILQANTLKMSDIKLSDGEIPGIYDNNMPSQEIKGVGTKSSIIDRLKSNTDKSLNSLQTSEIGDDVKYYTLEDQILRIDVMSGVNGFKYNRSYYFNNGVLYFAFIYSASNQNSLYFYNGEMYRYIDEKGEMKQNEFKDDVFKTLGNFALNEAYSFYDYKVGVKSDRG